jgi:hypothetical protein
MLLLGLAGPTLASGQEKEGGVEPPHSKAATKTVSGKLRRIEGSLLTVQKPGLVRASFVEIYLDGNTKKSGQVVQGMHVKVKYREEPDPDAPGQKRKVAVEIEARPEHASKTAREAAKQTNP